MLKRKMLRDIKHNLAQFLSVFILSAVAMWCYTGFQANVIGGGSAREEFNNATNFSDGWIYGASFDKTQADAVKAIDKVKDVQLRTEILARQMRNTIPPSFTAFLRMTFQSPSHIP